MSFPNRAMGKVEDRISRPASWLNEKRVTKRLPRRLAEVGGTQPCWSPDGRRIAFASAKDGSTNIYVMDADGTNVTRLTEEGGWSPSWSSD
ncbi:MAG: PD40 domain-containing protein [Planctomycetes bacterium]|nr:PD40 domain-containing protein [Planctomycetota bacterium]